MTHLLPVEPHQSLVRRIFGERQRRTRYAHLRRRLTPGIELGDCRVELTPGGDGIVFQVEQSIRTTKPVEAGMVAADLTGSPFLLEHLNTVPELDGEQDWLGIFFGPADWRRTQGGVLKYQFVWRPNEPASPNILMLPTNLLRDGAYSWVPSPPGGKAAPTYAVVVDENLRFLNSAFVRTLDGSISGGQVLAGALFVDEHPLELEYAGSSIWLSEALAERLRPHLALFRRGVCAALDAVRGALRHLPSRRSHDLSG
ncbi:MAG: hypothetical protein AB7L66_04480 [Gemmatimonadales bacterium]